MNIHELAREIVEGRRLNAGDEFTALLEGDLEEVREGADWIRRELCGDVVELCSIVNGRGGRCSENCKFCAQSAHHHTDCEEYGFLSTDEFVADCGRVAGQGIDRYSIVTAGRTLEGRDLEKAVDAYRAMRGKQPGMLLCASHGLMKTEDLKRLREAGVTRYHANLETSRRYFSQICTTHTYDDKLEEIRRAREAGLEVCSGGILGMGETWQDRIDMALELAGLQITSIPLNFLIPIPGTPLADTAPLTTEEIVRIVALFRYINPTAQIRIAAGRSYFEKSGDKGGSILFRSGANAVLTGDMLTTVGNRTAEDRAMLAELGYKMNHKETV